MNLLLALHVPLDEAAQGQIAGTQVAQLTEALTDALVGLSTLGFRSVYQFNYLSVVLAPFVAFFADFMDSWHWISDSLNFADRLKDSAELVSADSQLLGVLGLTALAL